MAGAGVIAPHLGGAVLAGEKRACPASARNRAASMPVKDPGSPLGGGGGSGTVWRARAQARWQARRLGGAAGQSQQRQNRRIFLMRLFRVRHAMKQMHHQRGAEQGRHQIEQAESCWPVRSGSRPPRPRRHSRGASVSRFGQGKMPQRRQLEIFPAQQPAIDGKTEQSRPGPAGRYRTATAPD